MIQYSIYDGETLKFRWDSNTGDETYYEPCFGLPGSYEVVIEDISAQLISEQEKEEALRYLASTDWYVIRFLETGVAVPSEITTQRSEARLKI